MTATSPLSTLLSNTAYTAAQTGNSQAIPPQPPKPQDTGNQSSGFGPAYILSISTPSSGNGSSSAPNTSAQPATPPANGAPPPANTPPPPPPTASSSSQQGSSSQNGAAGSGSSSGSGAAGGPPPGGGGGGGGGGGVSVATSTDDTVTEAKRKVEAEGVDVTQANQIVDNKGDIDQIALQKILAAQSQ